MSTEIRTIVPTGTVAEARSLMRANRIRHLLVRDGRRVVGIVSDRDLGGRVDTRAGGGEDPRTIAEVMSPHLVTATPDATIRAAANLMRGHTIGCLAVVADGEPVGIVTTTDLLELIGRGVERPIERGTQRTLSARGHRGASASARRARSG